MTDVTIGNRSASFEKSTFNVVLAIAKMATEVLREWRHNYRSRQELALYSHDGRNDLSFSANVDAEIAKPFWRK